MTTRTKVSATTRETRAAARRETAEQLHTTLTDHVAALTGSDQWRAFLDSAARFHSYSLRNLLLILAQRPDASQVAGYNQWLAHGRHVRKGAKGIRIYGFSSKKVRTEDPTTGEDVETKQARFPILCVFDEADTDPITEVTDWMLRKNKNAKTWAEVNATNPSQHLTGDDTADIYGRAHEWITSHGWTVAREDITGETNGYTTTDGTRRIVVDGSLSPAQSAKTLLHEIGHALMHTDIAAADYVAHQGVCEVEAESVAYIAAGMLGLDTSGYTVGYIAGWADGDLELIKATATRVLSTARTIVAAIDPQDSQHEDAAA